MFLVSHCPKSLQNKDLRYTLNEIETDVNSQTKRSLYTQRPILGGVVSSLLWNRYSTGREPSQELITATDR